MKKFLLSAIMIILLSSNVAVFASDKGDWPWTEEDVPIPKPPKTVPIVLVYHP